MGSTGGAPEPSAPPATAEAAPQVQTILERMRTRYRAARTYSDDEVFKRVSRDPAGNVTSVTNAQVRTRWAAPNRLAFHFHEDASEYSSEQTIVAWTPRSGGTKGLFLEKVEEHASLADALHAYQGVSHGASGMIARWLVDGGCQCSYPYELSATEACGTGPCFVLRATPPGKTITLHVDVSTYALRRAVWKWRTTPPTDEDLERFASMLPPEKREAARERLKSRPQEDIEDTLDIEPRFDVRLDDAVFELTPPPPHESPRSR